MTLEEVKNGQDFPFSFRDLQDCHVHIQHNNNFIRFTDQDGLINEYKLRGFPNLTATHIEVQYNYTLRRPNGEILKQVFDQAYAEPETDEFMMAAGLPIGIWEFAAKQAVNGLTLRLAEFDGSQAQDGVRVFDKIGNLKQPVVIEVINVQPETKDEQGEGQADGSLEVVVINGTAPYQYSLDADAYGVSENYQDEPIFSGLNANTYTVTARDSNGVYRQQTVIINQTSDANAVS